MGGSRRAAARCTSRTARGQNPRLRKLNATRRPRPAFSVAVADDRGAATSLSQAIGGRSLRGRSRPVCKAVCAAHDFRRFLAHGGAVGRRTVENLSSRSRLFASIVSAAQTPRDGRLGTALLWEAACERRGYRPLAASIAHKRAPSKDCGAHLLMRHVITPAVITPDNAISPHSGPHHRARGRTNAHRVRRATR